jgi:hypothetical protein
LRPASVPARPNNHLSVAAARRCSALFLPARSFCSRWRAALRNRCCRAPWSGGTPAGSSRPIRRKVFTAASAYHVRFELRGGFGDREISGFRFPFSSEDSGSISEMVKGGAEVLNSLDHEHVEHFWHWFDQAALVRLCATIRIRLGEVNIGAAFPKGAPAYLQRVQMFFCAPDADFGAEVRLYHGSLLA